MSAPEDWISGDYVKRKDLLCNEHVKQLATLEAAFNGQASHWQRLEEKLDKLLDRFQTHMEGSASLGAKQRIMWGIMVGIASVTCATATTLVMHWVTTRGG